MLNTDVSFHKNVLYLADSDCAISGYSVLANGCEDGSSSCYRITGETYNQRDSPIDVNCGVKTDF